MTWSLVELARRSDEQIGDISHNVLNRLCKWRSVYAGWQLGTRADTDPECQAVRDQRDLLLMLRAELNALSRCLIAADVITVRTFTEQVIIEAEALDAAIAEKFPGFRTSDAGVEMYDLGKARETMAGWRP